MGDPGLQTAVVTVRRLDLGRHAALEALLGTVALVTGVDVAAVRGGRRCPHCGQTDHGRPWATADGDTVGVGLARTPGITVFVVGPGAVGVDVERRSRVTAARLDAFTAAERRRGQDPAVLWAVKEAVLKRDGRGLRVDPRELDVMIRPDGVRADVVWAGGRRVGARPGGTTRPSTAVPAVSVLATGDPDVVLAAATDPGVAVRTA